MYIIFNVDLRDEQYYGGIQGKARTGIPIPEHLIDTLDIGSIFRYLIQVAKSDYDKNREEKKEEED